MSVRASVRASTLSIMNISETSRPIAIKFYLKHHWGGGKAVLGSGADQIRTLVSMATDSSRRVIMGKKRRHRIFSTVSDRTLFILSGNNEIQIKSLGEIWPDSTLDYGVSYP